MSCYAVDFPEGDAVEQLRTLEVGIDPISKHGDRFGVSVLLENLGTSDGCFTFCFIFFFFPFVEGRVISLLNAAPSTSTTLLIVYV